MVSTVLDLTKFSMAMDQNLIVSEESKEAMFTPTVSSSGQALPNGLRWFVHEHDGRQLVSHYGHQPESYSSLILKVPEDDLTLILQASNADTSAPFNLGQADVLKSPFARAFIDLFANGENSSSSLLDKNSTSTAVLRDGLHPDFSYSVRSDESPTSTL